MTAYIDPAVDGKPATSDEDIVKEAYDRWKSCQDWQGEQDTNAREDIKFANGDARNNWQWPAAQYESRTGEGRDLPCLTINTTRVHNDMIINEMSKNNFGVKVRPIDGKASYKAAEMMQTLIMRTQYLSNFTAQRRRVSEQQVDGGIGYLILETSYVSEKSFDQDVFLRASRDPTGVCLDPWITEPDGSDARFGFVFKKMPRREFARAHPKMRNKIGQTPFGAQGMLWLDDKSIMVVKYYRRNEKHDTLIGFTPDGSDDAVEMLASEIRDESGQELLDALLDDIKQGRIDGRTRKVTNDEVEWFLIGGHEIIERGPWIGKYVPICRCVGRETVIDNTLDRKGHTRPLISAQEMLNYAASTDVQVTALQPKSPWLAPAAATEGQEGWKTANVDNFAVLLYNHQDEDLNPIPPPQRIDPPRGNQGYQLAMQNAERQMQMISGQRDAQLGQDDRQSASSGVAINERKEQSDTATYHFAEHQADMLSFVGRQLLDIYPKLYDTKRALHCMGDDGEKYWITIDPHQTDIVQELEEVKDDAEAAKIAFNPRLGSYECVSDPGPDFATQRQEAWNAMSMILQSNKELTAVCSDLLFKYGDFPGADKIMERLQKEIKATKPYLFDDAAEPQMLALQQQNQRLIGLNAELMQKLAMKELALKGKDERRDIEASHAETSRLKVQLDYLTKVMLSPADKARMEHELESKFHDASMQMIVDANASELAAQAEPESEPEPA